MKKRKHPNQLGIVLNPELRKQLELICEEEDRPLSSVIRQLLQEALAIRFSKHINSQLFDRTGRSK